MAGATKRREGYEYTLVILILKALTVYFLFSIKCFTDSMGGSVIVLCFVALGLQLAMGSNTYTPDDGDYNYSGSAGECRLNVYFVKVNQQ